MDCEYYDTMAKAIRKQIEYHIEVAREYKTIDLYIAEVHVNEAQKGLDELEELYSDCEL